jgi:uncharacterized protein (DUF2236 family)
MPRIVSAEPVVVDGIAWRIHRERVLLAGWGRAILLQIAHPAVARGVAEHSAFTTEPWGRLRRLHRTLDAMLTLTFGTDDEALAVAGRINAIHDRVHGTLGPGPGGPSYSAHDPALLAWVHATLLDSFLLAYRLFVGPLSGSEADRYCVETSRIGPWLGIPSGRLPRAEAELRGYLDAMLESGVIEVTEGARSLAREIVTPPAPRALAPLLRLATLPTVGLLPAAIREGYRFPWDDRRARALRALAATVRGGLPLVPARLRYWSVARRAARRARPA